MIYVIVYDFFDFFRPKNSQLTYVELRFSIDLCISFPHVTYYIWL
jgi:hypothetical protein